MGSVDVVSDFGAFKKKFRIWIWTDLVISPECPSDLGPGRKVGPDGHRNRAEGGVELATR